MQKQRVVEENLRKSKEADQRHLEAQQASEFLKTPAGVRLREAMVKVIRRKILDEKDRELRNDMLRMIDRSRDSSDKSQDLLFAESNTFTNEIECKIKEELEDFDEVYSSVFETMMRHQAIRMDVLRELSSSVLK